jgi:hypothetical protein
MTGGGWVAIATMVAALAQTRRAINLPPPDTRMPTGLLVLVIALTVVAVVSFGLLWWQQYDHDDVDSGRRF